VEGDIMEGVMRFPIKTCVVCSEEFELKPDKPGFANRCPDCTEAEASGEASKQPTDAHGKVSREANEARREAMKNLLYRKDS
jgi:hypothetical protein